METFIGYAITFVLVALAVFLFVGIPAIITKKYAPYCDNRMLTGVAVTLLLQFVAVFVLVIAVVPHRLNVVVSLKETEQVEEWMASKSAHILVLEDELKLILDTVSDRPSDDNSWQKALHEAIGK